MVYLQNIFEVFNDLCEQTEIRNRGQFYKVTSMSVGGFCDVVSSNTCMLTDSHLQRQKASIDNW